MTKQGDNFLLGSMTLQEWIAALEAEENSHPFGQSITRRIRRKFPRADVRKSGADNKAVRDYVSHRLDVLWCDVKFWKILKEVPAAPEIQCYIGKRHKLCLPPFDYAAWRAMVANRVLRQRMFQLLRARPGTFTKARMTADAQDALEELNSRGAGTLLVHYIESPSASRRGLLRWFQLSDSTLREVAEAAKRLRKDVVWCFANKSNAKPEPAFFAGKGNPMTVEAVKELEDMVKVVRLRPHRLDTDESNARRYLIEQLRRDPSQIDDKELKKYAGTARVAKDLVEFREGLPVKRHVDRDQKRGLRPRRKNI